MWYVYIRHINTGKEDCVNIIFATPEEAIKHIAHCYSIDNDTRQLGEYYYFMAYQYDLNDLITLCEDCHRKAHHKEATP